MLGVVGLAKIGLSKFQSKLCSQRAKDLKLSHVLPSRDFAMYVTVKIRRELYEALAKEMGERDPEKLVEKLILEKLNLPKDMFGVDRNKLSPFTEKDRMEDRGW